MSTVFLVCNANQIILAQTICLNFHRMFSEKKFYLSRTTQNEISSIKIDKKSHGKKILGKK